MVTFLDWTRPHNYYSVALSWERHVPAILTSSDDSAACSLGRVFRANFRVTVPFTHCADRITCLKRATTPGSSTPKHIQSTPVSAIWEQSYSKLFFVSTLCSPRYLSSSRRVRTFSGKYLKNTNTLELSSKLKQKVANSCRYRKSKRSQSNFPTS